MKPANTGRGELRFIVIVEMYQSTLSHSLGSQPVWNGLAEHTPHFCSTAYEEQRR